MYHYEGSMTGLKGELISRVHISCQCNAEEGCTTLLILHFFDIFQNAFEPPPPPQPTIPLSFEHLVDLFLDGLGGTLH